MTLATTWAGIKAAFQKDEVWVATELAKAKAAILAGEQEVQVDVLAIFTWISTHQASIDATLKAVLSDVSVIGGLIPQTGPIVTVAVTAIDAATAAIDVLGKGITQGATPISTVANAYVAVKAAQTAVNGVLTHVTSAVPAA